MVILSLSQIKFYVDGRQATGLINCGCTMLLVTSLELHGGCEFSGGGGCEEQVWSWW